MRFESRQGQQMKPFWRIASSALSFMIVCAPYTSTVHCLRYICYTPVWCLHMIVGKHNDTFLFFFYFKTSGDSWDRTWTFEYLASTMATKLPAVANDIKIRKSLSTVTTNHLKKGAEPTPETSYILNMYQTMNCVQRNAGIMNKPKRRTYQIVCLRRWTYPI